MPVRRTALVLLAAALAAAWWWWREPAAPDAAIVQALSQVGASAPAVLPAGSASAASVPAASDGSEGDVPDPACPPQWRALAGKSVGALEETFQRLRPATLAHAAQLLSASADPFERIAGRLLAARARDPEQIPDAESHLALVSEALASTDPRIAALATQLCNAAPPEHAAACSSISPMRWASLDPDNAQAWLAVATDAFGRGDAAAARDALDRAAQSHTSRLTWSNLMPLPRSPALQGLSPVERQVLTMDLVSAGSLLQSSALVDTSRLCSKDAVVTPRRREACSSLARLLIDQGETLHERGIGVVLAGRVGWPTEQVDALAREQQALAEALVAATGLTEDGNRPMNIAEACQAYHRAEAVFELLSSRSEVKLAQRALRRQRAASSP